MPRRSLRPHLNQLRTWVRQGRTDAWVAQLALVDRHVELLAERLPAGTTLLVTADHGMAAMVQEETVDAAEVPEPVVCDASWPAAL